ncbi:MAG: AraC family transcriptional regulator [Acidobacteriota bacterium]|nr:AraC family transcriptional regulator [Acidobacteriota bacterium]
MAFHDIECERHTPGGVRLRVSNCAPHASTPRHTHERPFVCLILAGVSVQRAGARELTRERGRAYFYPANEIQSERFGAAGGRIFALDLADEYRLPDVACELSGPAALFARRCWSSRDDLDLDESAAALVGALSREREDCLRWMHVARDFLHAHFAEKLTLRRIADAAGVHPVHLCRAFPRRFGTTVGEYLRALRVDEAARRLAGTEQSIAAVALDAGFDSQSHLTRNFRARLGITPAAYRAALR